MSRTDDFEREVRGFFNDAHKMALLVGGFVLLFAFMLGVLITRPSPKFALDRTNRQEIYEYCLSKASGFGTYVEEAAMKECLNYLTYAEPKEKD